MAVKKETSLARGKKETTAAQGKASSPDKLTKTGKKGDVELTENDLNAVSGGSTGHTIKYGGQQS